MQLNYYDSELVLREIANRPASLGKFAAGYPNLPFRRRANLQQGSEGAARAAPGRSS